MGPTLCRPSRKVVKGKQSGDSQAGRSTERREARGAQAPAGCGRRGDTPTRVRGAGRPVACPAAAQPSPAAPSSAKLHHMSTTLTERSSLRSDSLRSSTVGLRPSMSPTGLATAATRADARLRRSRPP